MQLNKLFPDRVDVISRETMMNVTDIIAWIYDKNPDIVLEVFKALGKKHKDSLNQLENYLDIYR